MSLGPEQGVDGVGITNDGYDSDSIQSQNGHDATEHLTSSPPQSQQAFATQVQNSTRLAATPPETVVSNSHSDLRLQAALKALAHPLVNRTNDPPPQTEKTTESVATGGGHEGTDHTDIVPSKVAFGPRDVNDNIRNHRSRNTTEATPQPAISLSQEELTGQRTTKSPYVLMSSLKSRSDRTTPQRELSHQNRMTSQPPVKTDFTKDPQVPSTTLDVTKNYSKESPVKARLEAINPSSSKVNHVETQPLTHKASDPWEGMTRIHRRDIKIPSEQEMLLQGPGCWTPVSPGKRPPERYVPQKILEEWNRKFSLRNVPLDSPAHLQESAESPVPANSPILLSSESEFVSESEDFAWSQSPEHENHRVPPDSSPPEQQAFRKPHSVLKSKDGHGESTKLAPVKQVISVEISPPSFQIAREAGVVSQQSTVISEDSQIKDPTYSPRSHGVENGMESSDESDMDISVPQALDASVQKSIASQLEVHEISSSVPSELAPTLTAEKIQIANTPAAGIYGNVRKANSTTYLSQTLESEQSSSAAAKSSSQSIVANSYEDGGHHVPADKALVQTTQSSCSTKSQASGLDSHNFSIPSHQGSQALVEIVPNSSNLSMDRDMSSAQIHTDAPVTQDESTQGSSVAAMNLGSVTLQKRPAEDVELSPHRPAKRMKPFTTDTTGALHQFSAPSDGRHDHQHKIDYQVDSEKARQIFDKFKRDYPSYSGDYVHFTRMCSKLHTLRSRGMMQKSFLWDDFVIQHLRSYAIHLQYCLRTVDDLEGYETYFLAQFSSPDHKKRSLTASGIALVASECAEPVSVSFMEPDIGNEDQEPSVDKSVVARVRGMKEHSAQTDISGDVTKATRAPQVPEMENGERVDDHDYDEMHETASIELGEDEVSPEADNKAVESSVESENKSSVITSMQVRCRKALGAVLRTPIPKASEPNWSDDPNTPLKRWAREEQNLLTECRRRGGRILTDETGAIQPEQYTCTGWEDGIAALSWRWRPPKTSS